MTRIDSICNLIKKCKIVCDVGSDHSHLSIKLLSDNICEKVINIEKNVNPLEQGIKNLTKKKLLDRTLNIKNNGFNKIELFLEKEYHNIDYCVIAGLGSSSIIKIINSNNDLNIKNFICQTNRDPYSLRKFIVDNKYEIIYDEIIKDKAYYYPLILFKKTNNKIIYSNKDLFFGKINIVIKNVNYNNFFSEREKFLEIKMKNIKVSNKIKKEYKSLMKRKEENASI